MSIYKVNKKLPRQDQIDDLNEMILEINGKVEEGKFNKNEIVSLYSVLGVDRKYAYRDTVIGNTVSTYTGWSNVQAEDGYSIWKYTPTNYKYNANNKLYFDNTLIENRGEADSETATTFDKVYLYDGSTYVDDTTEAGTEGGTEFPLMDATDEYLYVGDSATFEGIKFEFQTRGSNYTLKVEYYNGGSGDGWEQLTANTNDLDDDTFNLQSDGRIHWTLPSDWATTSVNSQTKYWIRISTTTTPVSVADAYYVIPGDSVIALLALSSTEFLNEDWAWCSFNSSIYVTIRNTGDSAYEGDYYITSASSATNLRNFFVYNHTYKSDYEDSSYDPVVTKTANYVATGSEGIIFVDATSMDIYVSLPTAVGNEGKQIIIKAISIGGAYAVTINCNESGQTIDGEVTQDLAENKAMVLVSNGTNWYIISNY